MKTSDQINELAAALAKAQGEMSFAKKDSANPFYKSTYADLAAVVDAIKTPLANHQLSYVQATDHDDSGAVIIETRLMHSSGQWIESRLRMMPAKPDPQGVGSTITYGRRYALQSMVGIPADDDDGNAGSNLGGKKKATEIKEKTPYPDDKFETFLPKWREAITAGKRTADEIIATVNSGGDFALTEQQRNTILRLRPPATWTPTPEEQAEIRARELQEMGEQA